MAQALELLFTEPADTEIRQRWQRLEDAGVPSMATRTHRLHRPHVTMALASAIPEATRKALRRELELLSLPDLWLSTLGTLTGDEAVLFLGAIVDTEVLAVHSAVHAVLAGKVTNPSAYYFPGGWIPHCTLAMGLTPDELAKGFAALVPPAPVRARIGEVAVVDTRTGEVNPILG